jgi:hypothetical protein
MQDQTLTEIQFRPGIIKEPIGSADEGFWYDADKIRFRFNKPELMGGWRNVSTPDQAANVIGQPRILETVRSLTGERAAVIGTDVGLFASNLSKYEDVTPLMVSATGTDILSTTADSREILVSISAHGLVTNSIIGFVSAATTIGDNILINAVATTTAAFQVVSVVDANSFYIQVSSSAAATSVATGGDITVLLYYTAGRTSNIQAGGWGGGVWNGNFGWGEPTGSSILLRQRLWSMDAWGTELMAVPSQGPLFLYSPQNGIFNRFVLVTAAPSVNNVVRVATESRHVILYGTHDVSGNYDPLLVRWCSQEDYTDWVPTLTNTAGDFRLNSSGSEIVNVQKMRDQHLILTDADAFVQAYIGPNDIFGFSRAGSACGLLAQNAVVEYSGVAYWMGNNGQFFKYDGRIQPLPCTVLRYIYDNLDPRYIPKITCGTNSQFDELIWFYTSTDSVDGENDRYVIFNPVENHWTIGTLRRNAWKDRSVYNQILAAGGEGEGLFYHELGLSADTSLLSAFIESAYFDMSDGDPIMFSNKFVPDFRNPENQFITDSVQVYLKARKYPGGPIITKGPYTVTGSTERVSTRLRGREFALRIESNTQTGVPANTNGKWRLNEFRMALEADGKR